MKVDLVTNFPKFESKSKSSKNGLKSGLEFKSLLEHDKSGKHYYLYVTVYCFVCTLFCRPGLFAVLIDCYHF